MIIEKCYFEENRSATNGGSIFLRNGKNLKVFDNYIVGSLAYNLAGGVFLVFVEDSVFSRLNFVSCKAFGLNGGMGIYLSSGVEVVDCRF